MKPKAYVASCLLTFVLLLCGTMSASAYHASKDSVVQDSLVGDKLYYLELRGTVRHLKGENKDEAEILDSAIIKVFNEKNVMVAEFRTNKKGRCNFKLPLNRKFVVHVSKAGFVTKMIEVNTKVPLEKKLAYIFPFSVDIFEEVPGLDLSVLKKPIARISYLFPIQQFDYDNVYTSKINTDLKKMYKDYYFLQKVNADSTSTTAKDVKVVPPDTSKKKKP
jgi:hypothetical protein